MDTMLSQFFGIFATLILGIWDIFQNNSWDNGTPPPPIPGPLRLARVFTKAVHASYKNNDVSHMHKQQNLMSWPIL